MSHPMNLMTTKVMMRIRVNPYTGMRKVRTLITSRELSPGTPRKPDLCLVVLQIEGRRRILPKLVILRVTIANMADLRKIIQSNPEGFLQTVASHALPDKEGVR